MNAPGEKVALVTGATRGVGKGVARSLAAAGYVVYGTGRSAAAENLGAGIIGMPCDATDEQAIAGVVDRIASERGRLDVLVNSAWGGYERMVEDGKFTWAAPFWQQPLWRWDAMLTVGVRGALVASQHAAHLMVPARQGLIALISHWAAQKHLGNVLYGVAKAATDKLTADMARELDKHGVTVVSIYPGLVRTEAVLAAGVFDLSNSESPEFTGRAVAALAADPLVHRWNGQVVVAAALALVYGFTDIDGKQPRPLTLSDV
ncbi:MAG: short-chain dehydrogenase [Acidobacteria bacterium]|nr:MAG: short-chain dehydrogenase [Acidobacteriota bacterium]PYR46368.1 MAG: short-chain dehydrogenase [Acidobacteriota bacterium]